MSNIVQLTNTGVSTSEFSHHPHPSPNPSISDSVRHSLETYLQQVGDLAPSNLYSMVLEEVEKPLICTVLEFSNGNQSRAAALLGLSRGTLRKKMAQYNIQ